MSDFRELVKSFPKTREYVRDFFVYGFKSRNEFREKSPRTYDNERRRLESWLGPYVQKTHTSDGTNIFLAIDSNLLDTNPLFQVWKTKSFTDNDLVLHFLILDLLKDGRALTAKEITDLLLAEYGNLSDLQTVRRKCTVYAREGLLERKRKGKTVVFSLDCSLALWLKANEDILDALAFYQMSEVFGIVGNHLTEQLDYQNRTFRVKHSFCVHTLEDEILLGILDAMNQKRQIQMAVKSTKKGHTVTAVCVPLQILISTRSGRRYLCGYVEQKKRFSCFRLDSIRRVLPLEPFAGYELLTEKLVQNHEKLWGVSFQGKSGHHLDKLSMTIQAIEPGEHYIVERLKREGRGGTVTKIAQNIYQYETEVFDCNEMLPWIRTFTGRILKLKCTDSYVEQRFYRDLEAMYKLYHMM